MDEAEAQDEFGRALVELVRDPVVADWLRPPPAEGGTLAAQRLRTALAGHDVEAALRTLVPDIVDGVLGQLLWMLDTDNLRLACRSTDGSWVDLSDSGAGGAEFTGWLSGPDGWVERFSQQPFNDQVDES